MTDFRYAAYKTDGTVEKGDVTASTREEAVVHLARRGLTPFEMDTVATEAPRISRHIFRRSGNAILVPFFRELANLLSAELALDDALGVLASRSSQSGLARTSSLVLRAVQDGSSLSNAIERHMPFAPAYVISLLKAGEARGALGSTMDDIARQLEGRSEIEDRIRSALIYPAILVLIALGTLAIAIFHLFPALQQLFEDSGVPPPTVLALARDVTSTVANHWPELIAAVIGCGIVVGMLLRSSGEAILDSCLNYLPIIGTIRKSSALAASTRTLSTLLRNGVPLISAMQTTSGVVRYPAVATGLGKAMEQVREGKNLSQSLEQTTVFPDLVIRFVRIGEETGRLDAMLAHCATIYERDTARTVDRAMVLLTPCITILVGLLVGGIILTVMQAVLSVNSLAAR